MRLARVPVIATAIAALALVPATSAAEPPTPRADDAPIDGAPRCELARSVPSPSLDAVERGLRLWLGDGVPRDLAAARRELEHACEQESAACMVAALMYETGEGVPVDKVLADAFLRAANGDTFDLGACEEAAPLWTTGVRRWSTMCCRSLRACEEGCQAECDAALERIRDKTTRLIEHGCARGVALACYVEATLLSYGNAIDRIGRVVPGADPRATSLYDMACRAGVAPACTALAVHFDIVDESFADPPDADPPPVHQHTSLVRFLESRACRLGDGPGCQRAARRLERESGLPRAIATYERACDLGMHAVCKELGEMYSTGDGVPQDPDRSARFAAKGW